MAPTWGHFFWLNTRGARPGGCSKLGGTPLGKRAYVFYSGQFKAILNHFVVILWSLWGHFLGSFFGHFWGHFLDHFLEYVNNRFNRLKNICVRSYKALYGNSKSKSNSNSKSNSTQQQHQQQRQQPQNTRYTATGSPQNRFYRP